MRLAGIAALSLLLAACTQSGTGTVDNTLNVTGNNQAAAPRDAIDEFQDPRAYCPKTVLRAGTETYDIYPEGVESEDEGASAQLRFRATISELARECNSAGSFLNIRVGVRGRYLSGPSGETGDFTMPVRVAVTQADSVLYTQLHQIPARIEPGTLNGTFAYVDENVSIPTPQSENVIIYVGFDEGPYDTP